jgi:hypothetical protein
MGALIGGVESIAGLANGRAGGRAAALVPAGFFRLADIRRNRGDSGDLAKLSLPDVLSRSLDCGKSNQASSEKRLSQEGRAQWA